MNYLDMIVTTQIKDVRVNVLSGNIFDVDALKVLPINEFFSIEDNDWRAQSPRSVLGQFIKRLSASEREKFQSDIDSTLNRDRPEEGKIGYPYGWTILLKTNSEHVFITNTVKYDMPASSTFFVETGEAIGEFDEKYYWAKERRWTAPQGLMAQNEHLYDKRQIYYDTFLLAIEQCVEGIIRASREHKIERLALPLLGAGWGGLDEKVVLQWLLAFIRSTTERETDLSLQEVNVVLPHKLNLDRQLVIRRISESPYGTCLQCGHRHDVPAHHRVHILEDELQIVEQRIKESLGQTSPVLIERQKNLVSELERLGVSVQKPKREKRRGGRPANEDNVWACEQIYEHNRSPQEVFPEWVKRRRQHGTLDQLVDLQDSFKKAIARPRKKGKKGE